jgi:hypothetical protein
MNFLCSISLPVYRKHLHLRTLFVELASEVVMNRGRAPDDAVTLRAREPLPASFRWPGPLATEGAGR